MKYDEVRNHVESTFSKIDGINRKAGFKKFFPFSTFRSGKLFEYGAYNYANKKYVHFYSQSLDTAADIRELESFVR